MHQSTTPFAHELRRLRIKNQNEKVPKSLKNQGLKAYERINPR